MSKESTELQGALEEVLSQFNVKSETFQKPEEDLKAERRGDYLQVIRNTERRIGEMRQQGEEMLQKVGLSSEDAQEKASNPANYTEGQWAALQNFKAKLQSFRAQAYKEMHAQVPGESAPKRRKKKAFSKKKDWLQM